MDTERTLIATSFVRVLSFMHGPGRHRDPAEEQFEHHELIFTLTDAWAIRSARGEAIGRPGTLILANQGEYYRCRHFDPVPRDRTYCLSFVGLTGPGREPLAEWLDSLSRPLFTAAAMPVRGDLRWYLHRLVRETAMRRTGFSLKVDDLCQSILVEMRRAQRLRERLPRHARAARHAADAVARARTS